MNVVFYLIFVIVFFLCIFKMPNYFTNKKLLIIYGISLISSFLIYILTPFLAYFYSKLNNESINTVFLKQISTQLLMSFLVFFFINIFILLFVDNIIEYMISFHKKYNSENIDNNPVKFITEHETKIKLVFRIFFMLGSMLMLYGVWFGKN